MRVEEPEPGLCARKVLLRDPQKYAQSNAMDIGVAVPEVAQPFRRRQHPLLPQPQARQDAVGEMRGRRHHAPGVARRAHAGAFALERDPEVLASLPAASMGKTVGASILRPLAMRFDYLAVPR